MSAHILDKLFSAMQGAKGIPARESTASFVLSTLNNPHPESDAVAARICEDFALTQKVLKLANSAMYAPFSQSSSSSSVSSALGILGADALLHVVLSTNMATDDELKDAPGLSKTLLASELAKSVCPDRSEDASIAALMYNLGDMMAIRFLPEEIALIKEGVGSGMAPEKASIDVLGMTLQQLGAQIAQRWNLPASIISIIDGTGDPTLVGVAQFASAASSLILEGKISEAQQLGEELNLPGIDKSKMLDLIRRKGEEDISVGADRQDGASELPLELLFRELSRTRWGSVEDLAGAMFAGLSQAVRTSHCLLFWITSSGDFSISQGHGSDIEKLRSQFRLTEEYRPTAFHAAIRNKVDVSISDVTKLKPSALPDGYADLLPKVNKFILLPVTNGRVVGLLYCDWESGQSISKAELEAIKKLRELFLPFSQYWDIR